MAAYLFTHPDVNNFFTSLRGLPNEELRGRVQTYMDANPQVEAEVNGIRQPVTDLRNRCDAPAPLGESSPERRHAPQPPSARFLNHAGEETIEMTTHWTRSWSVAAATVFAFAAVPGTIVTIHAPGIANADCA